MALRAEHHRHLRTLWKDPEVPWRWWALTYGWAQPKRFCWIDRRRWRFHLTPIHLEHWGGDLEIGLCLGKRSLILRRHR